ncbi:MAG: hypothetical protein HQ582_34355 [Planctomycetes bacterium]|nr:hypothetical protein [Planctomycetota bacterium]
MAIDYKRLYQKYVAYVTQLHEDLDRAPGGPISDRYRARLLSFEDFCLMWDRWGTEDGLREHWLRRFTIGYESDAQALGKRLERALSTGKANDSVPSPAYADKEAA